MPFGCRLLETACFIALAGSISAQNSPDPRVINGQRAVVPPKIDGTIGASEWAGVPTAEGRFFDSGTHQQADKPVRFWLTYDEKYIYFAARMSGDPKKVVREEFRENVDLEANDFIGINIDPFGTFQNFNTFAFNAAGATGISLAGGRANKTEWSGSFEASARLTETGWEGECRIPWTILKLPGVGPHDLRFNVQWNDMTTRRFYIWQSHRGDLRRLGIWSQVELPDRQSDRVLNLLPFGYAGIDDRSKGIFNAGLDFKTSVTEGIEAVGTLNPDFRNIENQILSLDFSYFERLGGEARPFFLEGGQDFQTGFEYRLFSSQRLKNIDAGVKAYGQITDSTRFGLLSTWDFGKERATVANVRQRVSDLTSFNASYVDFDAPGRSNQSYRLNLSHRLGDYEFYSYLQGTDDEQRGKGTNTKIGYFRQSGLWESYAEYGEISSNFFPRIGFAPDNNLRGFYYGAEYTAYLENSPYIDFVNYEAFYLNYDRLNGDIYRRSISGEAQIGFKNQSEIRVRHEQSRFEQFRDHETNVRFEFPRDDRYRRVTVGTTFGRILDKPYVSVSGNWTTRPIARLQLSTGLQWVNHFDAETQAIISANYDIGKFESVGGRIVSNGDGTNFYLSYRHSGGRGNEFFLILGDPNADRFRRQLILKAVMPITIRY